MLSRPALEMLQQIFNGNLQLPTAVSRLNVEIQDWVAQQLQIETVVDRAVTGGNGKIPHSPVAEALAATEEMKRAVAPLASLAGPLRSSRGKRQDA